MSLNEAKVYSALLGIGQTSAGEIIKTTLLHRSVVYEILEKLITRKLVIKIEKQKIAFYQVTDPSRILQNIKAQEDTALELLPKLKNLAGAKLPEIVIYEGLESYRRFWLDAVSNMPTGSTDFVSGSIGKKWFDFMGSWETILRFMIE